MFRKLTVAAVAALGLFAAAPVASADPVEPRPVVGAHEHYTVYYRACEHEPWTRYGCYGCICEARKAAGLLVGQKYQVQIVQD